MRLHSAVEVEAEVELEVEVEVEQDHRWLTWAAAALAPTWVIWEAALVQI
jgi:hypothetical protein